MHKTTIEIRRPGFTGSHSAAPSGPTGWHSSEDDARALAVARGYSLGSRAQYRRVVKTADGHVVDGFAWTTFVV